jgi:hypothetical protein
MIGRNDFETLETQGIFKRVSKETLQNELTSYGGLFSDASDENYISSFDYIEINSSNKYMCHIDFWIDHRQSDLTLLCQIQLDEKNNIIQSVIEDIHVL